MKIVSLLPSATEIVYALGLGDALVGVTDECDFPPDAVTKPVVSRSALPQGRSLSPAEIDAAVRAQVEGGRPMYVLDTDLLRREHPDVILTQDLCRVCAVPAGRVEAALAKLGLSSATRVISLDPNTLDEVIAQLGTVGELLGAEAQGRRLADVMRTRVAKAKETAARLPTIRVVAIDWSEPPSVAGHWVPEMVEAVGGSNLLNGKGRPARPVTHREVRDAMPEVLVFMPCGYYLEEAEEEAVRLLEHPELADTPAARNGNVFAVDATSFFSRPGPRVVDGVEILGWAIHPEAYPEPPPNTIARVG
jgi:iron complex transport system substrate-binding protein